MSFDRCLSYGVTEALSGIPDCNRMVGYLAAGQGYGAGENFVTVRAEEVIYGITARAAACTGYLQRKCLGLPQ